MFIYIYTYIHNNYRHVEGTCRYTIAEDLLQRMNININNIYI